MLTIVDDFSRECLGIEVDISLSGEPVTRVLNRLTASGRLPERLLTDNGPEFTGQATDSWAYGTRVQLEFIEPGKTNTERIY